MRCSTPAPTSRPTARSSAAAARSPTPSPSGSGTAARRLLERGAGTNLWQAAALGLLDRVRDELARATATQEDLDNALWCAAHGGQRATAQLLLDRGADPTSVGHDDLTAAQAAARSDARELAAWLGERAAGT